MECEFCESTDLVQDADGYITCTVCDTIQATGQSSALPPPPTEHEDESEDGDTTLARSLAFVDALMPSRSGVVFNAACELCDKLGLDYDYVPSLICEVVKYGFDKERGLALRRVCVVVLEIVLRDRAKPVPIERIASAAGISLSSLTQTLAKVVERRRRLAALRTPGEFADEVDWVAEKYGCPSPVRIAARVVCNTLLVRRCFLGCVRRTLATGAVIFVANRYMDNLSEKFVVSTEFGPEMPEELEPASRLAREIPDNALPDWFKNSYSNLVPRECAFAARVGMTAANKRVCVSIVNTLRIRGLTVDDDVMCAVICLVMNRFGIDYVLGEMPQCERTAVETYMKELSQADFIQARLAR